MAAKAILFLCAQVLLIQSTFSQCVNRGACAGPIGPDNRWGYNGLAYDRGLGYPLDFPSSGGGLPVSSASPFGPTGLSVVSENVYEGTLTVIGELPFLGAVALEGSLPSAGAGAINYGCGNGVTAMVTEGVGPAIGPAVGTYPGFGPGRLGYEW